MTGIPVAAAELVDLGYLNEVARGHWRKTSEKDVTNSTSEIDLLNGEITIDAGALSTTRALLVVLAGDMLQNFGNSGQAGTPRLKLGGTTIWGDAHAVLQSATRRDWWLWAIIANLGVNNSQFTVGRFEVGEPSAGSIAGLGNAQSGLATTADAGQSTAQAGIGVIGSNGTTSIDTSAACALAFTWQWASAATTLSMRLKNALILAV